MPSHALILEAPSRLDIVPCINSPSMSSVFCKQRIGSRISHRPDIFRRTCKIPWQHQQWIRGILPKKGASYMFHHSTDLWITIHDSLDSLFRSHRRQLEFVPRIHVYIAFSFSLLPSFCRSSSQTHLLELPYSKDTHHLDQPSLQATYTHQVKETKMCFTTHHRAEDDDDIISIVSMSSTNNRMMMSTTEETTNFEHDFNSEIPGIPGILEFSKSKWKCCMCRNTNSFPEKTCTGICEHEYCGYLSSPSSPSLTVSRCLFLVWS